MWLFIDYELFIWWKKNVIDYYRGKDCLKLTGEERYGHDKRKLCFLCKRPFSEIVKMNYIKVRDHCHYTWKYRVAPHKICNLMYSTTREILVIFHNGSSYNYHFIIKGLAEQFEGEFECLGENKEKYIIFSVPIKKELNKGGTIIYRIKFIDSFRFMSTSL